MADNTSTVQFRADIAQLKAEMQAAQRSVRLASSEFQKATAGLDDWSASADGLQAKIKQLDTTLAAQKKQVELARREWEKTAKQYGENSAEADRAKMRLNNYEAQVVKTERELKNYNQELEDCKNETGRFAKETEDANNAVEQMGDGFTVAKGILADLVASGIRLAINALKDLATEAVQVGISFEQSMSKVSAISGASAEEVQALTDKAKEMGEKTVFSASEAASAFQYMAMAGWDTKDMLSGIEGIMNLAAASGEDLATTSDIVTDALTAMGYSAGDAGRLADVMAAASSNANTNVALMGATFQYAAPLVGALGYNMEDTAVAIGLMANAGIKGQKAGTALRSIITRLSTDAGATSQSLGALGTLTEELGVQFYKADGSTRALSEVIQDARKAWAGLSSEQQTQYAKTIAGQEAISGWLALMNAAETDVNKLTTAVKNSSGAASEMADVMNDNVGGQLTLLKSKIEGIMIKLFEKASDSMRGGIERVGEALDSVDWDAVGEKIGQFAEGALDIFSWIIRNGGEIIETLKSIAKVALTIWAVKKISQFSQALNGAIAGVKAFAAAMKAGEAATTAASAAGGIFSALISPGGAIVLGITAVIAATAALISIFGEEEEEIKVLTEAQEESIKKSQELAESYKKTESARKEAVATVQAEFTHYSDLVREMDGLVSANGQVKEGYEDRVAFILNELNNALGTEMKMTDGVIENYAKERQAINELLETKKAQAILQANEAAYTEAIQKQAEATAQYADARKKFNEAMAEATRAGEEYAPVMAEIQRLEETEGISAAYKYQEAHQEIIDTFQRSREAVNETRAGLKNATEAMEGYNQTIKNYEGLSSAIISGDTEKINDALLRAESGMKDHANATADILKEQADAYKSQYEEIKKAYEEGDAGITADMVKNAENLAKLAAKEYEESGKQTAAGYKQGIKNFAPYAAQESAQMGEDSVDALNDALDEHSPSRKTEQSGENFAQGFINGMNSKESAIYNRAYNLAKAAIEGLKEGQKEGSPSKITYQSGKYFVEGYINGISSMSKGLVKTVKKLTAQAIKETMRASEFETETAAKSYTEAVAKKSTYILDKIQYQNEQKLKEFDKTISDLQEKISNEQNQELKKQYQEEIKLQQQAKTQYQTASQKMIQGFTQALNGYQTQASNLITNTLSGISAKYTAEYNALIGKQNDLISKLKEAGDLYGISGSGVLTVSDIQAQTAQIKDYTEKLKTIKSKVTAELFDEIAALDMTEGAAYIDRLLAMSEKELSSYNKAYQEKLKAAEEAGKIYKKDIWDNEQLYKEEIKKTLEDLPDEMEALGNEALKGFLKGLVGDNDYLESEIKTLINAMVDTFKKELDIHSPSRLLERIGDMTGAGFVEGIKNTINEAKQAAERLAGSVATPLEKVSTAGIVSGGIGAGTRVTNNYNLVQNNTSPRSLSALETYRARRAQIQMVKAMT